MTPFGEGDIDYATFFTEVGAKGYHNPMYEQDTAPGGTRTQGSPSSSPSSATTTWRPCAAEPRYSPGHPGERQPRWWRPIAVAAADATPGLARPTLTKDVNMKSILRRGRPRAFSTLAALSLILAATGGALAAPAAAHSGVDHGSEPGAVEALDWSNYEKITLTKDTGEPIDMAVLPDGRVLHTARNGDVRLTDPDAGTTKVVTTVPGVQQLRGRDADHLARPGVRDQPVGLPLLRAAHHDGALPDDDPHRLGTEQPARRARPSPTGTSGRATTS